MLKRINKKAKYIVETNIILVIIGIVFALVLLTISILIFEVRNIKEQNHALLEKVKEQEEHIKEQEEHIKEQEEHIKEQEEHIKESESLPSCDSSEITDMVIENFKRTPLFFNNEYNTLKYAIIINPTTVKFEKDIPRYECVAQIKYNYNYKNFNYPEKNNTSFANVNYSISKSLGKPVIYTDFKY